MLLPIFCFLSVLQQRAVHHQGVVLHHQLLVQQRPVPVQDLAVELVVSAVAAEVLRSELMVPLHDPVTDGQGALAAPLALQGS